jgi:hypothetical protein
MAIECDGDEFHGPDRWQHDMSGQRVLEVVPRSRTYSKCATSCSDSQDKQNGCARGGVDHSCSSAPVMAASRSRLFGVLAPSNTVVAYGVRFDLALTLRFVHK